MENNLGCGQKKDRKGFIKGSAENYGKQHGCLSLTGEAAGAFGIHSRVYTGCTTSVNS